MRWLIYLIFIALQFATFRAYANPLVLTSNISKVDLSPYLTFLRDPTGHLNLDDVTGVPGSKTFASKDGDFNFGITTDAIWLRLEIQRAPTGPIDWWLELAPATIGEARLYQVSGESNGIKTRSSSAGILLPLSSRELKLRQSTFRISLNSGEPQVLYMRLKSTSQLNVRAFIWQPAFYAEHSASENLLLGFYYGAFALIVSLSAIRWSINRRPVDFWWLVYLIAEGFVVFRMNGLASRYLFPEFPSFSELGGVLSLSLMVWTSARFGIHAFGLDNVRYRYSYHAAAWIGSLALLAGVARLSGLEPASSIFLFILALLVCILNCFCSYRFLKSAEPSAKFYFLGIWFMTACVVLVLARNFGFIPAYQFIDYVWQSNLIVHATLISLGMVMTQREATEERRRATDFRSRAESNLKYGILQKQMIALVSHEFRNSLAMLNALMHTINKRKDLPSEVVVRHQNMVRVHQQMRRMIDNFLLGERIENADIKISGRQTDVGTLIQEVISFAELESKQHVILVDACDFPELVWLDDGILRLTLTNLLDNAVKYSPAGSKIILNGWYANGLLHMSVSDNGIGMSADTLSRMFEPHFKADLQSAGLGIGLSMVRMMLRAHGGDMRVTSAIGDGTTLNFWLKTKSSSDADVFQLAEGPVN